MLFSTSCDLAKAVRLLDLSCEIHSHLSFLISYTIGQINHHYFCPCPSHWRFILCYCYSHSIGGVQNCPQEGHSVIWDIFRQLWNITWIPKKCGDNVNENCLENASIILGPNNDMVRVTKSALCDFVWSLCDQNNKQERVMGWTTQEDTNEMSSPTPNVLALSLSIASIPHFVTTRD